MWLLDRIYQAWQVPQMMRTAADDAFIWGPLILLIFLIVLFCVLDARTKANYEKKQRDGTARD